MLLDASLIGDSTIKHNINKLGLTVVFGYTINKTKIMSKIQQQLFCSEIVERASAILESGECTDCKFVVGVEPHQVVVGSHKLVMAMASPVFKAMFYGSLAETRDYIPIVDVEPEIFKAMLQYMNKGNINISSWSEACQLYYAANKYMLKQLMELCSEYLDTNLNVGNVCQIYEHSLLFEDNALTQKCKKMFRKKTKYILKDNSFTAAQLNTVTTIFSLETLNLASELDLIKAAARYAEAQDVKNGEEIRVSFGPSTSMNEIDKQLACGPSNLKFDTAEKQLIRSAVSNIRFLTLTPQLYANCAARFSLLTPSEDYAVHMNIVHNKSDVPMPSGLSSSRVNRVSKSSFNPSIKGIYGNSIAISEPHYYRKLKWQIKLAPYLYPFYDDKQRFSLICTNENQTTNWSCDASAEIKIICQDPGVKPLIYKFQHVFSNRHKEIATQKPTSYDLMRKLYLRDASINMKFVIKVNKLVGV